MSSIDGKMEKASPENCKFFFRQLLLYLRVIIMNIRWKEIIGAFVLGALCPAILFTMIDNNDNDMPQIKAETTLATEITSTTIAQTISETTVPAAFQLAVVMSNGEIKQMDVNDYLTAVVLREMPADFESEALKAQAVVARTYALRRAENGSKHTGAAVCTDSACCQGFISQKEFINSGGTQQQLEKVRNAVVATTGQVLTYNGKLAEATYFSCSGGMTEDAKAVWGSDVPYLQAVKSPGEEKATHYTDTISFSTTNFAKKFGDKLTGAPETWIESITYTDGGGVDKMKICGKTYKGTQVRSLLGLRSTAFVITIVGDTVSITTKGYGHRVGMSQYGADAMAVQGSDYVEILTYYYGGTKINQWPLTD